MSCISHSTRKAETEAAEQSRAESKDAFIVYIEDTCTSYTFVCSDDIAAHWSAVNAVHRKQANALRKNSLQINFYCIRIEF